VKETYIADFKSDSLLDHSAFLADIEFSKIESCNKIISFRDLKNINSETITKLLEKVFVLQNFQDFNHQFQYYNDSLTNVLDELAPIKVTYKGQSFYSLVQ